MLLLLIVSILVLLFLIGGYMCYKYRIANRVKAPKDVVILYQVSRGPLAPSVSPFPMKLETFLRMMQIPYMINVSYRCFMSDNCQSLAAICCQHWRNPVRAYKRLTPHAIQNDHAGRFSSKRKTPWIELNGTAVADSQLAIEFLKKKFDLDPDSHLTNEEWAIGRAFLKLTEENLYWTMCIEMFGDNLEAVKTVIPYRGFKLWLTVRFLRKIIAKETWGHGIGRHSNDDVWNIAVKDLTALSNFLGTKHYLLGERPSEVDCAIFGMLSQIYWHMPGSRHQKYIKDNLTNLVDYIHRMRDKFWPDWESVTRLGKSYTDDHGKLYFQEKLADNNSVVS